MPEQYAASGSGSASQEQQGEGQAKPLLKGVFQGDWATDATVAFLAESYTVFSSLKMVAVECLPGQIPSTQTMQHLSRVSALYRSALSRAHESLCASSAPQDEARAAHLAALNSALHLAATLYLPADGEGAAVVGEELLHWVNCADPAPRTEEGEAIAGAAVPHEHPAYWDYVLRCVLRGFHTSASSMLQSLTTHASRPVATLASNICVLLSSLPRSSAHTTEASFSSARRAWLGSVRALLARVEGEMDEAEADFGEGDEAAELRLEFEAQFRCLLELAAGVKERVFEACEDWIEALGAWGTLVQPTLRRDDVPATMSIILEQFPIDATLPSESLLCALVKGDVLSAVRLASTWDAWLSAHLTDLFDKAALLLTHDTARGSGASMRNAAVLQYAETLLDDSGLWRMSIDYLATAGPAGLARMRDVVLSVPLAASAPPARIQTLEQLAQEAQEAEMDTDADDPAEAREKRVRDKARKQLEEGAGEGFENVEEVLRACVEYGLEEEARAVCKHMAKQMAAQRRYGVALAYCVRASDARQVRRIADALLDEYVAYGAPEFVRMVDAIPPSLLRPVARAPDRFALHQAQMDEDDEDDGEFGAGKTMYSSPLAFLARYRDFHNLYAMGELRGAAEMLVLLLSSGIAPERFWAVLVFDAIPLFEADKNYFTNDEIFELLRIVELISSAASAHAAEASHYLGYLERILLASEKAKKGAAGGEREIDAKTALKRLDVARLGLARATASVAFE